jgi:hypothetical protein
MKNQLFRGRGQGRGRGGGAGQGLGRGSGQRMGRGGGNRPGSGPGGNCVCPNCGYKQPHTVGQRCMDISCPKCGTRMVRE